jgi:outer membrane lipoprotein-sorting protein
MKAGEVKLFRTLEETVCRRKTRKVEVLFERDRTKGYYGFRVVINLVEEKKVPIKIQIYDWDDQLVESDGYENLNLNAELTDSDFDPKNPEYRF